MLTLILWTIFFFCDDTNLPKKEKRSLFIVNILFTLITIAIDVLVLFKMMNFSAQDYLNIFDRMSNYLYRV